MKKMEVVLSLFDGMSCGQLALKKAGIEYEKYYASEIDIHAIKIAKKNFPETVHLGSVLNVKASQLCWIDLIIGGSPCQGFSFAGKNLNFEDPRSKLFFEFVRIVKEAREINPEVKFLLENVKMAKANEKVITEMMGVEPVEINSNLVSAQNRKRLDWTNIGAAEGGLFGFVQNKISKPKDKNIFLKDILEDKVEEKYYLSDKLINYIIGKKRLQKKFTAIDGIKALPVMANYFSSCNGTFSAVDCNGNESFEKTGTVNSRYAKGTENFGSTPFIKEKANCFTVAGHSGGAHSDMDLIPDYKTNRIRRLTPIEVERLQTVPDKYTEGVSNTQRYKMLGNGWTIDVIAHIFSYL